jgi:hypothetical protein
MKLDEYLMPNYVGPGEREGFFDTYNAFEFSAKKKRIQEERNQAMPFRKKLPPLSERVTVAELIQNYTQDQMYPNCLHFPDLRFSGYESSKELLPKNLLPGWVDPKLLTTLRHFSSFAQRRAL